MTTFAEDTQLEKVSDGRYRGRLEPDWNIIRGANGGHIAAIVLRGMALEVNDAQRQPRSLTTHFLRVPASEPFEVEAKVERTGRTMSTVTARMVQNGKPIAICVSAFATERTGPDFSDLRMPEVPPPDSLQTVPDRPGFTFGHHFDFRPAIGPLIQGPGSRPESSASDPAEIGLWIRLREQLVADHLVVTQFMDAFAPAVFVKLGTGAGGAGVPTVEMTTHFRESLPLPGASGSDWYLGLFRTLSSSGGFIEEDGWLWSADGKLVAQSRQLALVST